LPGFAELDESVGYFETEFVQGEQEFASVNVDEPSFAELQDLLLRPHKTEKKIIICCWTED
jgi:hypothetical protein